MDEELFKLCKEVYERTGLKTEEAYGKALTVGNGSADWYDIKAPWDVFEQTEALENGYEFIAPAYTSDYLLEKLEKLQGNTELSTVNEKWRAAFTNFTNSIRKGAYEETPLKALLKLTIALDDAGVKL